VRNDSRASARRRSFGFLARFLLLLLAFYALVAWRPVNDRAVVPFTAGIARAGGWILNRMGERVTVEGTRIGSAAFSVNVENGCNGIETALLFGSAVLAYPAPWAWRAAGLAIGFAAIELVNLMRVVSLFWIGAHRRELFTTSHTVLWQSAVVLVGVLLFLLWATRGPAAEAPRRR
jgi:exosortase H (IPTLxxWG-CTERM-specific)